MMVLHRRMLRTRDNRYAAHSAGFASLVVGAVALVLTGVVPAAADAQRSAIVASSLVFDGVTVVDVERGALVSAQRVVITGNRIRAVGPGIEVDVPPGAQLVDARGKYLIPGLWDLHVHPNWMRSRAALAYPLFVAAGVTGIRDAWGLVPLETMIQWRREILAGTRVGPPRQILVGLPFSDSIANASEGHECPDVEKGTVWCLGNAADARRLVDSFKTVGADMIKTYNLTREMYFTIAAEARRIGIRFGGHVGLATSVNQRGLPTPSAIEASDSGASILDHSNSAGGLDTLCVERPGASVERCRPVAERLRKNNTWWVPTLGHSRPSRILDQLVAFGRTFWSDSGLPRVVFDSAGVQAVRMPHYDSLGMLRIAQRVGLPILAGTDAADVQQDYLQGFALHAELAVLVSEGLTPLEALRSTTLNPAKMLRATDSLGTVAPGKLADLVLLDADPLADITNTTRIRAVVADGRYFDRAALDRLLVDVQTEVKELQDDTGTSP